MPEIPTGVACGGGYVGKVFALLLMKPSRVQSFSLALGFGK